MRVGNLRGLAPTFGARRDGCGGFHFRVKQDEVTERELVAGLVNERLLVESLRGGQIRERREHPEEHAVAAGVGRMRHEGDRRGGVERVEPRLQIMSHGVSVVSSAVER